MNGETGNKKPEEGSSKSSLPTPATAADSDAGGRAGKMKILSRLASALGFGGSKTEDSGGGATDVNTRLAHKRTDLSIVRSYLAIERTLMAWIRTSLAMISFGFTIGKLGQILNEVEIKGPLGRVRTVSIEELAYFLVILGTVALMGAAFQHRMRVRELYTMGFRRQFSITFTVALVLVVLGGFTFAALILAL
jgi:putative membrane protein